MGLAPTTSTSTLLALGDALAMILLEERDFDTENYARFHPGGALGRQLMKVREIMRHGDAMTVVAAGATARETLIAMNATVGRPGAASVVDADGYLVGFFTDGDLAYPLEHLDKLVEAIVRAARTGQVGDGKIFITNVDQVVRIRTGEQNDEAL